MRRLLGAVSVATGDRGLQPDAGSVAAMTPGPAWEIVGVFGSRVDAEVAGSALRADGIPFRIVADDLGGNLGVLAGAAAGVRLLVPADHLASARAALEVAEDDWDDWGEPATAPVRPSGARFARRIIGGVLLVVVLWSIARSLL